MFDKFLLVRLRVSVYCYTAHDGNNPYRWKLNPSISIIDNNHEMQFVNGKSFFHSYSSMDILFVSKSITLFLSLTLEHRFANVCTTFLWSFFFLLYFFFLNRGCLTATLLCPDSTGCQHGCILINNEPQCFCKPGYTLQTDRQSCKPIRETRYGNFCTCEL